MKITLYLRYDSQYGEELFMTGDIKVLQGKNGEGIPLEYTESGWKTTFYTDEKIFHYSFFIRRYGSTTREEAANTHVFGPFHKEYKTILIYDTFDNSPHLSRLMRSTAMSKAIRHHNRSTKKSAAIKVPIIFNTWCADVNFNHQLALSGNANLLGQWNESETIAMDALEYPYFCRILDANKLNFPLQYKYVISSPKENSIVCWEEGANHLLSDDHSLTTDLIIVNDACPNFNLPDFKGAGTAVPVFSLRTKESFGCGEFNDLKKLADWAAKTGQRIIQTLPINDTTVNGNWHDSYPYSAISVYALHPMYLNLEKVGTLRDLKSYKKIQKELNANIFVDYEAVNQYKWKFIQELFKDHGKETFETDDFKTFFAENEAWLKPYAVFSFLRFKFNTSDFSQWGNNATYSASLIQKYCQPSCKDYAHVAVHFFVQYHLHKQLTDAVQYVHSKGIAIKGDIPIGVNRNSVDVWQQPTLFDCNGSAGAPPDYFSRTGQVWGFPIYNWDEMAKDNYQWWKNRFRAMSRYFDAYRIDHILGFFRIFRTPTTSKLGLLGQFTPALPLSVEEIESFGIQFDKSFCCEPIINDQILTHLFGEQASMVKSNYLKINEQGRYQLNENVNSQDKITLSVKDKNTCEGLCLLCCQVLFVEDYHEAGKYHPRINIKESLVYPTLSTEMQQAMKDIYEYFYYRRHNEFWRAEAIKKLTPLINSTDMMVCGEDLGMVPQCVPSVMNELEILSLEIQRMPKDMYVEFGNLSKVSKASVCTTSTHDMSTMRQWWEQERDSIQRYFSNELHQFGSAPLFCEPWICQQIIENHLNSPATWVILPLQDWMGIDGSIRWDETFNERINDPSNPDNYWRYRMHIRIEDLLQSDDFNNRIKQLISVSKR